MVKIQADLHLSTITSDAPMVVQDAQLPAPVLSEAAFWLSEETGVVAMVEH